MFNQYVHSFDITNERMHVNSCDRSLTPSNVVANVHSHDRAPARSIVPLYRSTIWPTIMRVLVFANRKGGVGKTSAAVNIAAELGKRGNNVLLIDLDSQRNACERVGIYEELREDEVDAIYERNATLSDHWVETDFDGLYLIPSTSYYTKLETVMPVHLRAYERVWSDYRPQMEEADFDYVVFDAPASVGPLTDNGILASDAVLTPLTSEPEGMKGIFDLQSEIEDLNKGWNKDHQIDAAFFSRFDSRTNLGAEVVEWAADHFGERLCETRIPQNVAVAESYSTGIPVIYHAPHSPGAKHYAMLTDELIERGVL